MMQLLKAAWAGWVDVITQGKLIALFFAAVLFLWFGCKWVRKNSLLIYASIIAICCVIPVTAAVMMLYQTKFYDYEWIWSAVPVTAITAYALSLLLVKCNADAQKYKKGTGVAVLLLCVVTILLCGSMGKKKNDDYSAYMKVLYPYGTELAEENYRKQGYTAVESLREVVGDKDVLLWAPIEVMEYAREADAAIRLLYGRNMWDESLNAYAYDTYEDAVYELFLWMETVDSSMDLWTEQLRKDVSMLPPMKECVQMALDRGVNCILFSDITSVETVEAVADMMGGKVQQIEEYWVIYE